MLLANFALSTAIFLGMLEKEPQPFNNPKSLEERTETRISTKAGLLEFGDHWLVSPYDGDTLNRKKRELDMAYEPVCATKVSKVAPRFGQGYFGENITVLNGNTQNEDLNEFIQMVDFVFCQGENLEIGPEFSLTCEQRYTYVQLLVIGECYENRKNNDTLKLHS